MKSRVIVLFVSLLVLYSCSLPGSAVRRSPTLDQIEASQLTFEWLENRFGIVNKPEVSQLITRVTQRISTAIITSTLEPQIDIASVRHYGGTYPWQVFVLNTELPNAFSVGGGLICVTRGLILSLNSEAEFAAVIAHEMAHEILGHTQEAVAAVGLSAVGPQFSFSLDQELLADSLAVRMLKISRYDIRDIPSALSIVYRPIPEIVSNNDTRLLETRLSNLEQVIGATTNYLPATHNTRQFNRIRRSL